ncbi:hypothetical protein C8J57DRAFT_1510853 [Mycena rebaudengoi]|nr:hypothetical protein C8J57DRAFT_1510853 [Mycena rebaudengoi]
MSGAGAVTLPWVDGSMDARLGIGRVTVDTARIRCILPTHVFRDRDGRRAPYAEGGGTSDDVRQPEDRRLPLCPSPPSRSRLRCRHGRGSVFEYGKSSSPFLVLLLLPVRRVLKLWANGVARTVPPPPITSKAGFFASLPILPILTAL